MPAARARRSEAVDRPEDADFIAHARQDIPWLMEQVIAANSLRSLVSEIVCRKGPEGGELVTFTLHTPLCDELRKRVAAYNAAQQEAGEEQT